jgi:hypothetical protein
MADVIRAKFGNDDAWKAQLSAGRREHLEERIAARQGSGMEVEALLMTEFCDKATIVGRWPNLPVSRGAFKSDMASIQKLRDDLAHANDFAATPDAARQTCATVRLIAEWIDCLRRPPFRTENEAA